MVHVDEDQEEEVVEEVEEHVEEVRHLLIEAKEPNESEGAEQLVSEVGEVVTSDLAPPGTSGRTITNPLWFCHWPR